jgi:RNA polymerase-binding transcription factor DksA
LDAKQARKLLRKEKQRIQHELEELRADRGERELSSVDQHPADTGTELFEEERVRSMIDRLEHELGAVDRAMQRIEDGTYGLSVESGVRIPDARLEAVPHAERTVDEQARFEAAHRNSL